MMTSLEKLSPAHLVLLAVQQCLLGDITALPYLRSRSRQVLTPELCYRLILTFLPETAHPAEYVPVVERLGRDDCCQSGNEAVDVDLSAVKALSVTKATKLVNRLRLLPLQAPGGPANHSQEDVEKGDGQSLLVDFLIHRAHRIDSEAGLQPFILELINPFLPTSALLRRWAASNVLPLLRLNYEYFPNRTLGGLSLYVLESFDAATATNFFLSNTERAARGGQVGRDLRGLVAPWIYGACENKRRRLTKKDKDDNNHARDSIEDWNEVNEWLLSTSRTDFELTAEAIEQWDGPTDIDFGGCIEESDLKTAVSDSAELRRRYAQSALACIYATTEAGHAVLSGSIRILTRTAQLMGYSDSLQLFINSSSLRPIPLAEASIPSISRSHLLHNALSHHTNVLTLPDHHTLTFLDALLVSVRTLISLGHPMSTRAAADLCLLADASLQMAEFQTILDSLKHERKGKRDWSATRDMLLWLRDWCREGNQRVPGRGIFWRLEQCHMDKMILHSMLLCEQHNLAVQIYAKEPRTTTMESTVVETTVVSTILHCYDNATNGNKTRGQMKLASEILQAFTPYFPSSPSFEHIRNLIEATHSLSFYALTLQHGVPFRPISIRVHQDPLSLIEKVLEQNKKAYVRVQDLVAIGRQLVAAGFPGIWKDEEHNTIQQDYDRIFTMSRSSEEENRETRIAEHRIISMAVSSALDSDDFETANSLIMTRIAPAPSAFKCLSQDDIRCDDDIFWRAIYKAGNYRSPSIIDAPLYKQIHRLSQRMELLSLALLLVASPKNLNEILAAWRRCDEEAKTLRRRESQEEEEWAARSEQVRMSGETERPSKSSGVIPGRFTSLAKPRRRNDEDDAPMGLFDVARGAARALKNNAFPLRGKKDTVITTTHAATAPTSAGGSGVSTPLSERPKNSGDFSRTEVLSGTGDQAKRPRKRDMVSSMVTGGLASGLGWVLGAQPVARQENTAEAEHQRRSTEEREQYDELGRKISDIEDPPVESPQAPFVGHTEIREEGAIWGKTDPQPVADHQKAGFTADAHDTNVEDIDDAWEANWGNEEDETTEAMAPSKEDYQTDAAPDAMTSTSQAPRKKEDAEVGEDWEANWGWD